MKEKNSMLEKYDNAVNEEADADIRKLLGFK
jgi:hypothetical protein